MNITSVFFGLKSISGHNKLTSQKWYWEVHKTVLKENRDFYKITIVKQTEDWTICEYNHYPWWNLWKTISMYSRQNNWFCIYCRKTVSFVKNINSEKFTRIHIKMDISPTKLSVVRLMKIGNNLQRWQRLILYYTREIV